MIPRRVNLPGISYWRESISPGYSTPGESLMTPGSQQPRLFETKRLLRLSMNNKLKWNGFKRCKQRNAVNERPFCTKKALAIYSNSQEFFGLQKTSKHAVNVSTMVWQYESLLGIGNVEKLILAWTREPKKPIQHNLT